MKHRLFAALTAGLLLGAVLTGCGASTEGTNARSTSPAGNTADSNTADGSSSAEESAEAAGNTFVITLYPDKAPITCENFEKLVEESYFDGLNFHRVVPDFMAQGGDGTSAGKSAESIKGEFAANGVQNDLSHTRGIVSMARTQVMDSASSQFFICYSDDDTFLDGSYAAFGEVTQGMEVVDSFTQVPRALGMDNAISAPTSPIIMEKVEMIEPDENGHPRVQVTMNDFLAEAGVE